MKGLKERRFLNDFILKGKLNVKPELDWKRVFQLASQNRVLYFLVSTLLEADLGEKLIPRRTLERIKKEGNRRIHLLKKTLLFLRDVLEAVGIPYLVVRTYKYLPFVTWDVDVFVNSSQFLLVQKAFREKGVKFRSHDKALGGRLPGRQIVCLRKGMLEIDLHDDFTWMKSTYLDPELLWKNQRKQEIAGIVCPIPSSEVEFLLNMAHILYERFYITLVDFYALQELRKQRLNTKLVLTEVKKHGWDEAFLKLEKLLGNVKADTSFPLFLPKTFVLDIFFEKLKKRKSFDSIAFVYWFYALSRYYLSGKRRIPYYDHWYDFSHFEA